MHDIEPGPPAPFPAHRRGRRALAVSLTTLAVLVSAGVPAVAQAADVLRVGSKRFTESYILGELLTEAAAQGGPAEHRPGLGNTAIVFEALKAGSIDLYPDYTGTIAAEILKLAPNAGVDQLAQALAPMGIGVGVPLGFENTYALAVRDDAADLKVKAIGDLAGAPTLKVGLSPEFLGRADGWPGLSRRYGLPQQPIVVDHGLAYEALAQRQVDVIDIYSTDAKIRKFHLRVLDDSQHYFPRYDAVVLYRLDVPARLPAQWKAIAALRGTVSGADMIAMNAGVELDGQSFAAAARRFLVAHGVAGTGQRGNGERDGLLGALFSAETWRLTQRHLALVAGAVGIATLVGVPLGVIAARRRRLGQVLLAFTGMLQTVPSLAMLAILIPLLGRIGVWPSMIALVLYALLPIVRNTCTGIQQVPLGVREAGRALGFTNGQVLRLVDLPLASPVLLAGIKTAAVISVGTATIAAFVGAGGYGERITAGLALNDYTLLLAGAIPSAAMALVMQLGFELAERGMATPGRE